MSALAFEGFLSTPEMIEVFGENSLVQAMMDFEAALAHAQAAAGVIPQGAASAIGGMCKVELYDVPAIIAASGRAGSLAIPLVKKLTETVALFDAEAARYVHWGSTSQDVIDTAMVLVTRKALGLIERNLDALIGALFDVAEREGDTPLLAHTLMQPAQVVSFGFKLATWIAPLVRARQGLREAAQAALQLQLGGPVGTLSAMGNKGTAVAERMARELQLRVPVASWHTQRDEWVLLGCHVGVLCGSLGKLARDWSLMAQGEVGELAEPSDAGRGGSSALPHKRNPVAAMVALAAALRAPQRVAALLAAMPQEHERGLGNWQAELAEWAGLFISAGGAVKALAEAAAGLHVDARRMRENIARMQGLVHAEAVATKLAAKLGKASAHAVVQAWSHKAVQERAQLRDIALAALAEDPLLSGAATPQEFDSLFDADAAAAAAKRAARRQLDALRAQWQAGKLQGGLHETKR
jgi:3-carboxy-cis,cis-muconate cycloisomerase